MKGRRDPRRGQNESHRTAGRRDGLRPVNQLRALPAGRNRDGQLVSGRRESRRSVGWGGAVEQRIMLNTFMRGEELRLVPRRVSHSPVKSPALV